jgi:hypothetical protein
VNLHGAFLLLFAVLGVEIAAEVWERLGGSRHRRGLRTLGVVTVLCGVAGLVNPNGWDGYRYAFLLLGHEQMLNDVQEWASPDFHEAWTQPLQALLLVLTFAAAFARRRSARNLLLVVGLLHSMLYSIRHVPIFALACAPILAGWLADAGGRLGAWMAARNWALRRWQAAGAVALLLVLGGRVAVHARELPRGSWFEHCADLKEFPVRACDYLAGRPGGGRLYNFYGWGGYCIWRLWPRYRVFIDGRAEVYFTTSYEDHFAIEASEPGWQEKLRRWQVDTILVPQGILFAHDVSRDREWRLVYQDDQAVVFRRVPRPSRQEATDEE